MLNIQTSRIAQDGERMEGEEPGRILDLDGDPFAHEAGAVRYQLFAQVASGELVLSGSVQADLNLACSRCGEFFSTTVSDSSFLRAYDILEGVEMVDVTPDLREAILLYLPAFPLCRSNCAGLCPQCGANLNHGPCSCVPSVGGTQWDSLDSLQLE
jgi:uncharacterized metal-binding protein YceD (DUF177 family)